MRLSRLRTYCVYTYVRRKYAAGGHNTMSHYITWVVIEPEHAERSEERAKELLAPYDENTAAGFFGETEAGRPSKWDWYQLGGRWSGQLNGKDACLVKEVPEDVTPYALLLPDGSWHEQAAMGWFGMPRGDEKGDGAWEREVVQKLSACPDHLVLAFDLHI